MDYMDVVCNGKSSNPTSKVNVLKKGSCMSELINQSIAIAWASTADKQLI